MNFSIVVATDKNNGIGRFENQEYYIPWKSLIDMKFFKHLTTHNNTLIKKNVVIMGRNTFFSLPIRNETRCLSNRHNIVISSNPDLFENEKNVLCFPNLNDALKHCLHKSDVDKIYVIGGSKLYEEALKSTHLENIYWNVINETDKECNIFFPINNLLLRCKSTPWRYKVRQGYIHHKH